MKKRTLILCSLVLFMTAALPVIAEPIPPGPVCPDPCTEWFCNQRGICYCRPYPAPERCPAAAEREVALFRNAAHLPPLSVVASFAEEPDANACIIECKSACVSQAAAYYIWCLGAPNYGTAEQCTQVASDIKAMCIAGCEQERCGTPV